MYATSGYNSRDANALPAAGGVAQPKAIVSAAAPINVITVNTLADDNQHTDSDQDANEYTIQHANRDKNADQHTDNDQDANEYAIQYANPYTDADNYALRYTNEYAYQDSNGYPNTMYSQTCQANTHLAAERE